MTNQNDRHDTTTRSASPAGADALRGVSAFSDAAARSYNAIYLTALAIVRDRDTAADITQETFLRAWLKIDTLRDTALLEPWLARIARNTAAHWLRTGQHRSRVLPLISMEEIPVEPADSTNTPRQAASQAELNAQLTEAIMALPDDLRQAVLLHYAEGMTASDIARLNAEAPSTVTRRLDKARTLLRQHLESGLAASLAATAQAMRPAASNLPRTLGLLTAAAAIPAATRAQLLQAIADTPPPPTIDAVTSAANAAPIQEAGVMKSIIAKVGAVKLIAGAAALAAMGGGIYGVKSMTNIESAASRQSLQGETAQGIPKDSIIDYNGKQRRTRQYADSADKVGIRDGLVADTGNARLSPAERIALLKNDLITTNPTVTVNPGETTGTIHLDLQVVNESGLPVTGAEVKVTSYGFDAGAMFATVSVPDKDLKNVTTNVNGIARISVPSGPNLTQDSARTNFFKTTQLTATATHPDYTPTRAEMDFTSITKLVLTSGNILEVLPVDAVTSVPIIGAVDAEFNSPFKPEQYTRSDGTVVFRKIGEEHVDFILKRSTPDGKLLISNVQSIDLPLTGAAPVPVSLFPTFTVNGKLDQSIPRPVTDVEVHTRYCLGSHNLGLTTSTIAVTPDGTFALRDIPMGTTVSVSALGNGYCSVTSRDKDDHAWPFQIYVNQDNQLLTLPVNKTANIAVKVLAPDGAPVVGANVSATVSLMNMGNTPRWGGPYSAITDEHGIAQIKNIPPLKNVRLQMKHPEFRFPKRESKLIGFRAQSGFTTSYSHDVEVDLTGGGEFNQSVKAEVTPPETPATGKTMFRLPEGAILTYTMPPPGEQK